MREDTTDEQTIAAYDEHVDRYLQFADSLPDAAALDAFIRHLPPGGHVLDLGCGTGAYAAAMAKRGLVVAAIDGSPEMVRVARHHYGVMAACRRFDDLDQTASYDGVWANFSLLHAPKAAFAGHLQTIGRALKPAGILHLGLKLGTGEGRDRLGRFYAYYTSDELRRLLADAGFYVIRERSGTGTGLAGVSEDFITLLARI